MADKRGAAAAGPGTTKPQMDEGKKVAAIITLIGRLNFRLSDHQAINEARIGLAEWSALHEIARQPDVARPAHPRE
jgi:hypothetical protein